MNQSRTQEGRKSGQDCWGIESKKQRFSDHFQEFEKLLENIGPEPESYFGLVLIES